MDLIWKTIYQTTSPINGEIKVIESANNRKLMVEGFTQSRWVDKKGLSHGYWDSFYDLADFLKAPKNALILGLGAGTIPIILQKSFPEMQITAVEIDPIIIQTAAEYFELPKNIDVVIGNAAELINSRLEKIWAKQYELIIV